MFRKIYKQANDDIKPSEDMINRVILNAHKGAEKRQSPLPYRRYAKYAVSAAAAVVVVSAAVISMPYWRKTRDDGVIIEEQVSTPTPSDMSESVVSNTADTSYPYPTDSPQTIQNPYTPPPNNYSDSQNKMSSAPGNILPFSSYMYEAALILLHLFLVLPAPALAAPVLVLLHLPHFPLAYHLLAAHYMYIPSQTASCHQQVFHNEVICFLQMM